VKQGREKTDCPAAIGGEVSGLEKSREKDRGEDSVTPRIQDCSEHGRHQKASDRGKFGKKTELGPHIGEGKKKDQGTFNSVLKFATPPTKPSFVAH